LGEKARRRAKGEKHVLATLEEDDKKQWEVLKTEALSGEEKVRGPIHG